MTEPPPAFPGPAGPLLLPSDRFFVRVVPLAVGADVAAQIDLALESLAPFPLDQLYYGHIRSGTGEQALVFAAYRKLFSSTETAEWGQAAAAVPAFLALLGEPPRTPVIRVHAGKHSITALAWDGAHTLPVAVLARAAQEPADAATRAALVAEIRERSGLSAALVAEIPGPAIAGRTGGMENIDLDLADVRDKEFLASLRAQRKRDRVLWRGFLAGLVGLAALMLLEAGLLVGGIWRRSLDSVARLQAPAVRAIETAQTLSAKIEEMAQRRLLPFEMLALVNQNRPASVQFVRTSTSGLLTLEIEAQTSNATDVGQYEAALRAAPELSGVEIRDLRSRDGLTTFSLTVNFKPESLHPGAGP